MLMKKVFKYLILGQDVYLDDESAEVVISSLRLGDDQERYVENFSFSVSFWCAKYSDLYWNGF